jgi:DNA-binding response OmpR family regulator
VRELLARVKNVLRRATQPPASPAEIVRVGALTVDEARHEARLGAVLLDLTALEFAVLVTLARAAGRVFTREQLLEDVWGYDYMGDLRVVDAVVKRLRAKLREAAPDDDVIATVRGVGYKLDA